jgi:hypothetical protein
LTFLLCAITYYSAIVDSENIPRRIKSGKITIKKQCHISFLTCVTFVADVRYAHPVLLNWPALAQPSAYKYV